MQQSNENKTPQALLHPIVEVQEALNRLARGTDLNIVLTELKNEYIQILTSSRPDQRELREECYNKIAAYADLEMWVENYGKEA